jgi:hypothetical protein
MATGNAINANSTGLVKYDGAGTFSATTVVQHDILIGGASNAITSLALTNGQLAIGSTGADPSAATLTAGTGMTITNGAGSITLNAVGSGLSWTVVTAASQAMTSNNGYIANRAGTVAFTLPTTSAVGDVVAVTGINTATGWSIAYTTNQQIFFGTSTCTLTTGSLASVNIRDTVYLVCMTANLTWNVVSSIGNITVA